MLRTPRFIYASASESLPGAGFPKTYHQPPGEVRAFPDPFHRPIKLLNSPARSGTWAPWCLTSLVLLGLPVGEAPSSRSGNTGGSRPHPRGRPSASLLRVRGCREAGGAAAPDRPGPRGEAPRHHAQECGSIVRSPQNQQKTNSPATVHTWPGGPSPPSAEPAEGLQAPELQDSCGLVISETAQQTNWRVALGESCWF